MSNSFLNKDGKLQGVSLGIGTATPTSLLDVFGTASGSQIRASVSDGAGESDFGYGFYIKNAGYEIAAVKADYTDSGSGGSGQMFFQTRLNGTLTTRMVLASWGGLGIGNGLTNPTEILDVTGNIKLSGSFVAATYSHVRAKTSEAGNYTNNTTVAFGTEDYDTNNEYNSSTGVFTAAVAGKYRITAQVLTNNLAWTTYNSFHIGVAKNGSTASYGFRSWAPLTASYYLPGMVDSTFALAAGDTLQIVMFHDRTGGNITLYGDTAFNHLAIDRLV